MANETQAVTPTDPQPAVDYSKWYFKYDPQTYAFIPGAVHEKVDNSTDVEPSGLVDPVWSPSTNSWTGKTYDEFLKEQQANQPTVVDPNQQALSMTANALLKRLIVQDKRITELESKEAK
ncbi:hypothetical protein GHU05_07195 [Fructobacillus tropaeoli]|uniref:hypothetical protein n=1 Tax=Fructobacillus tropaeoli TaxID=709323 RepID=UPI0014560F29|nr:hypothetical protein [Fructobacillus tropaeoli]NLS38705.1 hypothetical protein [Fructobacillus tropaeoli]